MPAPSIDYLNARRELRKGSDHSKKRAVKYAPDYEPDAFEVAMSAINSFALWAEASRARYLAANGKTIADFETVDEIPF